MTRRRLVLIGLISGLGVGLAALIWVFGVGHTPALRGKVELPSLGAELLYLDGSSIVRRGSPRVVVLRFGQPVEFMPYHFKNDGVSEPQPIEAWAARLSVPVVFNAGQFDEKLDYLGWLKRDGVWLSPNRKELWKGLLVSGPTDGAVWGRIVDLDHVEETVVERYRHVIQSMMLLDSENRVRVRDSELTACRTVIAEDTRGRIMVIITEGATTLGDMARWLPTTSLDIVRAMNLDGGIESQLAIDTPELKIAFYGQHGTGTTGWNAPGEIRYPLPAVVAVRPRASAEQARP